MTFIYWCTVGGITGIVFASFFEWILHRYVMHRPVGKFDYPYRTHALTHHRVFKADPSYHLRDDDHVSIVTMAWWNGPVLILCCMVPFSIAAWKAGHVSLLVGAFIVSCAYYGAYEYLHYCMHVPRARNLERSGIFFRLNGHHLLHHRYMHRNFNVVLPLADLCLGTLLLRSKVSFAQATGPAVPDVQPISKISKRVLTAS